MRGLISRWRPVASLMEARESSPRLRPVAMLKGHYQERATWEWPLVLELDPLELTWVRRDLVGNLLHRGIVLLDAALHEVRLYFRFLSC